MGYKEENTKTISSAFKRMRDALQPTLRANMIAIMEAGVEMALGFHDQYHQSHIEHGDSYGYAIWHNGTLDTTKVWSEKQSEASVKIALTRHGAPSGTGWSGIVMAGMNPSHYFVLDYELDILNMTVSEIRQEFGKYFKEI